MNDIDKKTYGEALNKLFKFLQEINDVNRIEGIILFISHGNDRCSMHFNATNADCKELVYRIIDIPTFDNDDINDIINKAVTKIIRH